MPSLVDLENWCAPGCQPVNHGLNCADKAAYMLGMTAGISSPTSRIMPRLPSCSSDLSLPWHQWQQSRGTFLLSAIPDNLGSPVKDEDRACCPTLSCCGDIASIKMFPYNSTEDQSWWAGWQGMGRADTAYRHPRLCTELRLERDDSL